MSNIEKYNNELKNIILENNIDINKIQIANVIGNFQELMHLYNAATKEIMTKFEILDNEFKVKYDHNPIHHMEHRIKSPKSIFEKMRRKKIPMNIESLRKNITDIAGIRVICNYIDDIYILSTLLLNQDDVVLIEKKDYNANPKKNGYRSLHLIVQIPVFLTETVEYVPVEIQIRTIAMDLWASLEHELYYKSNIKDNIDIYDELYECSQALKEIDTRMQNLYKKTMADYDGDYLKHKHSSRQRQSQ